MRVKSIHTYCILLIFQGEREIEKISLSEDMIFVQQNYIEAAGQRALPALSHFPNQI
jgi:hypothetical protein